MTLRTREVAFNGKRELKIALRGEIILEEALDLSIDRLLMTKMKVVYMLHHNHHYRISVM